MADSDLLRSERVGSRLATGYSLRSGGPKAVAAADVRHKAPAHFPAHQAW